ncbi:hypothetical protein MUK42_05789 [Musa troglodytarum]|uniref:Centromere protein C n=1 Tax=Musa troglodytarum TaxID=320322 RepID=A0A9E7HFF7_9LILI|nr:hypothetical protein MUK42_05789 [Musa troglodytarum]
MESIEAVLNSMVLNCSKEVMEQAQALNKSCSIQDGDKTIPADGTYQPLGRRPALGRKRAMFRLKPLSGNPVRDFDFNSQLDHIDDPEEYFFAFEQLENVDKELKKLRGEVVTEAAKNQRATGRRRRPGILGKTVSYKPHFSIIDTTEAFNASKEDIDRRNAISYKASTRTKSNENLHPDSFDQPYNLYLTETNNGLFVGIEQEDSVVDEENNVNNNLEELLSSFKALDEGEGTALLMESLQIKSMEVGKMHLPEWHTVQRNDFRTPDNIVMLKKLEVHQLTQTSPNLARGPLAVIADLQRRISLNDPLKDPYMIPPSEDSPYSQFPCPTSCQKKKTRPPPDDFNNTDQNGLLARHASVSARTDDKKSSLVAKLLIPVIEADKTINDKIEIDKKDNHIQLDPSCEHPDHEAEDPAPSCTNHKNRKGLVTAEDHVISESITNVNEGGADDNMQNQVKVRAPDVLVVGPEASRENSIPWTTVLQSTDEHMITGADTETQGHNATSATSQNNGKKQKALPRRKNKRKLVSRRQSLADAGMMWKSGVKRSTRIKSRPLQYWCGERFLYGRIYDSLPTVIGLKYTGEDGKDAALKVKSFVSEEYADLVAHAALH